LVSTPCSAPILGGATAAALAKDASWYETVILFSSIGIGLSLPVLLVGFVPGAIKLIPRPGNWMNIFKMFVGFTLFGAAVFYFGTLQEHLTLSGANDFLWFLLCLSIALWWFEQTRIGISEGFRRLLRHGVTLAIISGAAFLFLGLEPKPQTVAPKEEMADLTTQSNPADIKWIRYTEDRHAVAAKSGRPILVDFTASWCVNCKAFKKTHLEIDSVRKVLSETGIIPMTVDLTKDKALWKLLNKLGRNGIPVYVIYMPDGSYDLLAEGPPIGLIERLGKASVLFPKSGFKTL
jgi:thiol:disulfide interchange protein